MKWVTIGALTGMISSMLVFQLGQARVWFAMSRDGLLPQVFSRVHPRFLTPHISTWVAGFFVAIPAGIFDIGTLADLSNIGTLFAFVLVSLGVLVLRRKQPERRRSFRTPWVPVVPILSILSCIVLMASLPLETWVRFLCVVGHRPGDLFDLQPASQRIWARASPPARPGHCESGGDELNAEADANHRENVPWIPATRTRLPIEWRRNERRDSHARSHRPSSSATM